MGDNMRLASAAGPGEARVSEAACTAARVETTGLEQRHLDLKGKREVVSVRVLHAD